MSSNSANLKKYLEDTFDIPFTISEESHNHEAVYYVGPTNQGKELFDLRITIRNKVSLVMEFVPQKYSVDFISAMGNQTEENRQLFIGYLSELKKKGAKCDLKVNGQPMDMKHQECWSVKWINFEARITKLPVSENNDYNPVELIKDWSSLMMGMILALAHVVPYDQELKHSTYQDGKLTRAEVNRYERNPLNRKLCLESKGFICQICGFDFEEKYGIIGHDFIHVHHIVPLSQIGESYIINPVKDLIPVCPNCHAMLHRYSPPLTPRELQEKIKDKREDKTSVSS